MLQKTFENKENFTNRTIPEGGNIQLDIVNGILYISYTQKSPFQIFQIQFLVDSWLVQIVFLAIVQN